MSEVRGDRLMIRECAWCKRILGEKEPLDDPKVTHGICENCRGDLVGSTASQKKTIFSDVVKEK